MIDILTVPRNEMGVIVLFSQMCHKIGFSIYDIQSQYPDCTIHDLNDENGYYLTEFEYKSSSFILHGHDIRDCDLVICWKIDLELPITMWELSTNKFPEIVIYSSKEKEEFHQNIKSYRRIPQRKSIIAGLNYVPDTV